jgi:hypothetical protein
MGSGWREDVPDPVEIPLEDVGAVIAELDRLMRIAEQSGQAHLVRPLDDIIGRMTRWVWPLLEELDDDEDYDG